MIHLSKMEINYLRVICFNFQSTKAFTASRANILTSVESLIPIPKTASKQNSIDKIEETKRKQINDENARRKRDEALRLQTEEKRR